MNHTTNRANLAGVVTYHPKDWDVLRWCIYGLTRKLKCSKIYVVGRSSERERVAKLDSAVSYIDEDEVVPGLTASSFSHGRWGWYFQQILKLSVSNILSEPYYLTVDADTVFLRSIKFFDGNRTLYATGSEYHAAYFQFFEKLLGFPAQREFSFITHHMLFCSAIVREMIGKFRCDAAWWVAVSECMASNGAMSFSEFETYGHYVKAVHPESFRTRQLRWRNVPGNPTWIKLQALALRYHFCSFHSYTRNQSDIRLVSRLVERLYNSIASRWSQ